MKLTFSCVFVDMIISSCVFAMVEKACPTGQTEPDEDFEFYIKGTSWELLSIRWNWDVRYCLISYLKA